MKQPARIAADAILETAAVEAEQAYLIDGILAANDEQKRPEAQTIAARAVRLRTKTQAENLAKQQAAIDTIKRLPRPGESVHILIPGNFRPADIIPAALRMAAPAVWAELYIVTLSFNRLNVAELGEMLDARKIRRLAIVASRYFRYHNEALYHLAEAELVHKRKQRILAPQNHAKILAGRLTNGAHIVVEGSANLRACGSLEQMAIHNDRRLFAFHAGWINEAFTNPWPQLRTEAPNVKKRPPKEDAL